MSSDSSQWPSPAVSPDFVYVLKIGDYQHVLRPADQKASENLVLAQVAVGNIDRARNLLTERGPFLLSEKQQKMDEVITDTEEAIERVIKLLKPARVEQISDESIRINTKNAWVLQLDEPRTAASFGRLQTTHNKLKTVLHDLKNITATAQLDNCEVRANVTVGSKSSNQTPHTQPQPQPQSQPRLVADSSPAPKDAKHLLAWKRNRKAQKQGVGSDASSVSRLTSEDHDTTDLRSPISSVGNTLIGLNNSSLDNSKDIATSVTTFLRADALRDDGSDTSTERLPVIPELDTTSARKKSKKPAEETNGNLQTPQTASISRPETETPERISEANVAQNNAKPSTPNPIDPNITGDPVVVTEPAPSSPSESEFRRDSFSVYRRKVRESRQEPKANMSAPIVSPTTPRQSQQFLSQPDSTNFKRHSVDISAPTSAVSRDSWASVGQPAVAGHDQQGNDRAREALSGLAPQDMSNLRTGTEDTRSYQKHPEALFSNSEGQSPNPPQLLQTALPTPQNQILSPSHTQLSPQQQTPSSVSKLLNHEDSASDQSQTKNHEIFLIDPVLTRLPTLLRAGQRGRSKAAAPYPVSDAESENETDQLSQLPILRQTQSAIQRPLSTPLGPQSIARATDLTLTEIEAIEKQPHHRSLSDTAVPQINVTRVPTIPRKPLPTRTSANSENELRLQTTPEDPVAVQDTQKSQRGNSGPPSPLGPEDQNVLAPRTSLNSIHSLSVQGPSSVDSSRKSSESANGQKASKHSRNHQLPEDNIPRLRVSTEPPKVESINQYQHRPQHEEQQRSKPSPSPPNRPPIPNPLSMHPVATLSTQPSAYEAQSEITNVSQSQQKQAPDDYRTPAFQQSNHSLDPRHDGHLTPLSSSPQPPPSRFRDEDQSQRPQTPNRSRTVPNTVPLADESASKPRRASEQDQVLSNRRFPTQLTPSDPMANENPPSELESSKPHASPTQTAQMVALKASLDPRGFTRTEPTEGSALRTKPVPKSDIAGRNASMSSKSVRDRQKDLEMFRDHRWMQNSSKPGIDRQANDVATSATVAQQWLNRQPFVLHPNQNRSPAQHGPNITASYTSHDHINHPHDCQCDDQNQPEPQPQTSLQSPAPAPPQSQALSQTQLRPPDVRRIRLTPVLESKRHKPFSSTYKSVDIPARHEFFASGALQVEGQAQAQLSSQEPRQEPSQIPSQMPSQVPGIIPVQTPGPISNQVPGQVPVPMQVPILGQTPGTPIKAKKRSNWLSHQASKLTKERRLQGV